LRRFGGQGETTTLRPFRDQIQSCTGTARDGGWRETSRRSPMNDSGMTTRSDASSALEALGPNRIVVRGNAQWRAVATVMGQMAMAPHRLRKSQSQTQENGVGSIQALRSA
jgi:hypothetical protein